MSYKTGFKNGRLGIGIPSGGGDGNGDPLYPLDINGDIRLTGAIVKADGTIYSSGGGVGVKGLYSVQDSNTGKYKFGVGKSNPLYTLDISGSLNLDGDIYVNGVSLSSGESTTASQALQTGNDPSWINSVTTDLTSDTLSSLTEEFDTLLEIANAVQDICDNNLVINLGTKANKASPTFTGTVTASNLNITGNFQMNGQTPTFSNWIVHSNENDIYRAGGNVGIGTTNPLHKLHVANLEISNTIQDLICLETQTSSEAGHPAVSGICQGILFKNKWHTNATKYSMARISAHSQPGYGGQLSFWTNYANTEPDDTLIERLRINHLGNVGIGMTAPNEKLSICGGDNNAKDYLGFYRSSVPTKYGAFGYNDSFYMFSIGSVPIKFGTNNVERFKIEADGKFKLSNNHTTYCAADGGVIHWYAGSGGGKVQMRIMGSWSNNSNNTTHLWYLYTHAHSRYLIQANYDGVGLYGQYNLSDDRLKHNEVTVSNALNIINKLTPKKYFKTDKMYEADHHFELNEDGKPIDNSNNIIDYKIETGFIAQELLEIDELKHLVRIPQNNDISNNTPINDGYGIYYNDLFVYNIAATQELYKENQELKTKVANLESELAAIKAHLGI